MDDAPTVSALVQSAEEGNASAWRAIVERYTPLLAAVIYGFGLQRSDAEDIVQTVWLRLVEHLRDLREPKALPMWIVTTARNECLRVIKTSRRTRPVDPTTESTPVDHADADDLDQRLVASEQHQALLAAIAELPDRQRKLLLLLVADPPVPYSEITKRLGIPVGSIGPTRARALQRLRESPMLAAWQETARGTARKGGGEHDFATLGQR